MSHLLYLHSFAVDRFSDVFGGGDQAHVEALLNAVPTNASVTAARARELVTSAVRNGFDWTTESSAELSFLNALVDVALTRRSFGIPTTPISPMGAGGALFDAFAERFSDAKATKLFKVLQRGRDYDGSCILLSPDDVAIGAALLKKIAGRQDPDDADELDEEFAEELLEPFTKTAKHMSRAIFGLWT